MGTGAEPTTPIRSSALDVDGVLGAAIDAASRNDVGVRVECVGIGDEVAIVAGNRTALGRAFERLLSVCVRSTRRGAAVTVALRRAPRGWTVRIEHVTRTDVDADVQADCHLQIAIVRSILHDHHALLDMTIDAGRGTRIYTTHLQAPSLEPT